MDMKTKFLEFEIKTKEDSEDESGDQSGDKKIEGVLSIIDKEDLEGDVMLDGCFDDALGKELKMLAFHDRKSVIGRWSNLRMEKKDLVADGTIYSGKNGFDEARKFAKLVDTGDVKGISIGFKGQEYVVVEDRGPFGLGYDYVKVELLEASLVDSPAMEDASVKSSDDKKKLKKLAEIKRQFEKLASRLK